jgi:exopolyphosphatase / guanosine-5'-triphosphate,3'-diphosphate pyrophosphatase
MIFASIDIGSNAVRLLFANAYEHDGKAMVEKATLIRIPVRLGMDVFKKQKISKERVKHLIKTLTAFKLLIEVYQPVEYCAYATAAMREAKNQDSILRKIKEKTGLEVQTIDGVEEANIIKELNNLFVDDSMKIKMYIDVGGGSTDISILEDHEIISSRSFKIGTIRLLENAVEDSEWDNLKNWLNEFSRDFGKIFCIGTGGNINKLGKAYADQSTNMLSLEKLKEANNYLSGFSVEDRINKLGMRPDRADVIIPAMKIYLTIMEHASINSIYVPRIGLADGLIYKMYKEYKQQLIIDN